MAQTDLGKWMITYGGEYSPATVYEKLTVVTHNNSTYMTLKTVTGIEPAHDAVNYTLIAQGFSANNLRDVVAQDTSGVLGDVGASVSTQSLIDWIADQVLTKLVKKADMSNVQVNNANKVPTSALAYTMAQNITTNANNITKLNNNLAIKKFEGTGKTNADLRTFLQGCVNGQAVRIFDSNGSLNGTSGNYIGIVNKINNVEMTVILVNHWTAILYSISVGDTSLIWKKYATA